MVDKVSFAVPYRNELVRHNCQFDEEHEQAAKSSGFLMNITRLSRRASHGIDLDEEL